MTRDWETQHNLLFKHDNIKFIGLTPRGLHQPVIERYTRDSTLVDMFLVYACALVLAVSVTGLVQGWL